MTIKTAPERYRTRNVENKLVHLIHLGTPSRSHFRHRTLIAGQRFRILVVAAEFRLEQPRMRQTAAAAIQLTTKIAIIR